MVAAAMSMSVTLEGSRDARKNSGVPPRGASSCEYDEERGSFQFKDGCSTPDNVEFAAPPENPGLSIPSGSGAGPSRDWISRVSTSIFSRIGTPPRSSASGAKSGSRVSWAPEPESCFEGVEGHEKA